MDLAEWTYKVLGDAALPLLAYLLDCIYGGIEERRGSLSIYMFCLPGAGNIPGLSSTDGSIKSEKKLSIPGLDVQVNISSTCYAHK